MDDKSALVLSNAGMRLIALQTLYNRGDLDRLHTYIGDYYSDEALATQSAADRLAALQTLLAQAGKMRVYQVLATDKHRVVVLMQAQNADSLFMHELAVEDDYPHRITQFNHAPLES